MGIEIQEKQRHEKYTDDQKKCENICTFYGENCNLEKHMKWSGVEVYLNCRGEDLANKHNQKF